MILTHEGLVHAPQFHKHISHDKAHVLDGALQASSIIGADPLDSGKVLLLASILLGLC
jgi:hypothetical protein